MSTAFLSSRGRFALAQDRILQRARENSQLSTQNMTLKSGVVWGDFQLTPISLVTGKDPLWLMEDFS